MERGFPFLRTLVGEKKFVDLPSTNIEVPQTVMRLMIEAEKPKADMIFARTF